MRLNGAYATLGKEREEDGTHSSLFDFPRCVLLLLRGRARFQPSSPPSLCARAAPPLSLFILLPGRDWANVSACGGSTVEEGIAKENR